MPTRSYRCEKCGAEWDEIEKMNAEPLQKCWYCLCENTPEQIAKGLPTVHRMISKTSFRLVGSGWSRDGYK